jgi:CheY-like chemotaxis protein
MSAPSPHVASAEVRKAQLERIEAVARLAGGLAHELNNLLAVMLGHAGHVLQELGPGHAEASRLAKVIWAGRRAGELTTQMLAFSRRQVLAPRVIRLDRLVSSERASLERLLGDAVELTVVPPRSLGSVRADPGQIVAAVCQLASNARDAMPKGGRLVIEFADATLDARYAAGHPPLVPGEYVMMAVTDTGHGMDGETLARAFEPFYTTKPIGVGTGLGLSTVYGIVKQSDGFVWIYSEPGHGTTFKVYLPRLAGDRGDETRSAARPVRARHGRILLVEDDDSVREVISDVLSGQGYSVEAASGADQALELQSRSAPFDLLVTDLVMPGIGGRELASRLGERQPGLRVLFVSGYGGEALALTGVIEPHEAFLQKPFSERSLLEAVASGLA